MGGRDSSNGYLVQALIALIDSLDDQEWTNVSIEPNGENEKVDIAWEYHQCCRRVQVKSTRLQFDLGEVKRIASEIAASCPGDELKLILVGSTSKAVASIGEHNGVAIPPPKNNDFAAMVDQAAHKLSKFLGQNGLPSASPLGRELLAQGLATKLLHIGTQGTKFTRECFINVLREWVKEFKPSPSEQQAALTKELFFSRVSRNIHFTGRIPHLNELDVYFLCETNSHQAKRAAITGLGGQGKTQVAVEFAYRNSENYQSLFWINAESEQTVSDSALQWAKQIGLSLPIDSNAAALDVLRIWLRENSNWLVILNNLGDTKTFKLLDVPTANGHYLITSRLQNLHSIAAKTVLLESLSDDDSVAFLLSRTGRESLSPSENEAVASLAREIGGLPLALEQAAVYINTRQATFNAYLSRFRSAKVATLERSQPEIGDYNATVATTWRLNVEEVRRESQASFEVLQVIAFLSPDEIPFEFFVRGVSELGGSIAIALEGFYPLRDESLLDDLFMPLIKYSLVKQNTEFRTLSVHRMVQAVTRHNMVDAQRSILVPSVLKAMSVCIPVVNQKHLPLIGRLHHHAISLISSVDDASLENEYSALLIHRLGHFCEQMHYYAIAVSIYYKAYEIRSRILPSNDSVLGLTANNLGVSLHKYGFSKKAAEVLNTAFDLRRTACGEKSDEVAQTLQCLGVVMSDLGYLNEAKDLLLRSLQIYRDNGNKNNEQTCCLRSLASVMSELGEDSLAEAYLIESQTIIEAKQHGFDQGLASTFIALSEFARKRGNFSKAIKLIQKAREIFAGAEYKDDFKFASCLKAEGMTFLDAGDTATAEQILSRCLEFFETLLGSRHPEVADVKKWLSACLLVKGDKEQAIKLLNEAYDVFRSTGHRLSEAEVADHLGSAYSNSEDYSSAIRQFRFALRLRLKLVGLTHKAVACGYGSIAFCYWQLRKFSLARQYYELAYDAYLIAKLPDTPDCFYHLKSFSEFLLEQGDDIGSQLIQWKLSKFSCVRPSADRNEL